MSILQGYMGKKQGIFVLGGTIKIRVSENSSPF